jgi:poly(beta-D-mannuronate) lyase
MRGFKNIIAVLCLTTLVIGTGEATLYHVSSASQISSVMSSAQPGDTLVMTNGNWLNSRIIFTGSGTSQNPIVLRAETPGQVFLIGESNLRIGGNHLIVDGLVFTNGYSPSGGVVEFRNNSDSQTNYSRLTNCAIIDYNPSVKETDYKWVSLYGTYNRVDHCYLKGKTHNGATLVVWLSATPNYHLIDSNYFGERPELGVNGGETIRVGTSDWSMYNSNTVVEYNYFEKCDGEIEIISSKSCENIYRHNTFVSCQGTLTLRHGNRNWVEGNFFFANKVPNSGGIRIIGEDHTVINNYISDCNGTSYKAGITIMNGVPDSPLNRYFQVKRALVAFNTLVNNRLSFNIGAGKDSELTLPPLDCIIANNVVKGSVAPLIQETDTPINMVYEGNIFHGATLGITPTPSGILITDPKLLFASDSIWRPSSTSPAIGGAVGNYPMVTKDLDGHSRGTVKDVGCDQVSFDPVINKPMNPKNAGPVWMWNTTDIAEESSKIHYFQVSQNYPNPFNSSTNLNYRIESPGYVNLKIFDILGAEVGELENGYKQPGEYTIRWNAENLSSGLYFYHLQNDVNSIIKKMTLVK